MAASVFASGTWIYGTTSVSPAYGTGTRQAGDGHLILVASKLSTHVTQAPSGGGTWRKIASLVVGTGTNGVDAGPILLTAFWKEEVTGTDAAPGAITLNPSTTASVIGASITTFRKASTEDWSVDVIGAFSDTTSNTTLAGTFGTADLAVGDIITALLATTSDTPTQSAWAFTGITPTTYTSRQNVAGSANGNDLRASVGTSALLTAAATGASVGITSTLSAASTGGGLGIRVRARPTWNPYQTGFENNAEDTSIATWPGGGTFDAISGDKPVLDVIGGGTIVATSKAAIFGTKGVRVNQPAAGNRTRCYYSLTLPSPRSAARAAFRVGGGSPRGTADLTTVLSLLYWPANASVAWVDLSRSNVLSLGSIGSIGTNSFNGGAPLDDGDYLVHVGVHMVAGQIIELRAWLVNAATGALVGSALGPFSSLDETRRGEPFAATFGPQGTIALEVVDFDMDSLVYMGGSMALTQQAMPPNYTGGVTPTPRAVGVHTGTGALVRATLRGPHDGKGGFVTARRRPTRSRYRIRIPAGTIGGRLDDFITRVDLRHMPPPWWAMLTDGGQTARNALRVRNALGQRVPFDILRMEGEGGSLFFRHSLRHDQDNVFYLDGDGTGEPAATDALGMQSVWRDYALAMMNAGQNASNRMNRVDGSTVTRTGMVYDLAPVARGTDMEAAKQGVLSDSESNFYVVDNNRIVKFSPGWSEVKRNNNPVGSIQSPLATLTDGEVRGTEIFVLNRASPATTAKVVAFSTATLQWTRDVTNSVASFASFVSLAWDSVRSRWWFTTGSPSTLYWYSEDFSTSGSITLSTALTGVVSIDYSEPADMLYLATADTVWRASPITGTVDSIPEWTGDLPGTTLAGIDIQRDGTIHVLVDEGSGSSRVYRFSIDPGYLLGDAFMTAIVPTFTSWTLGATEYEVTQTARDHALVSYAGTATNNTERQTILRATGEYGTWNNSDAWLFGPASPKPGAFGTPGDERHRLAVTQSGTLRRRMYVDGNYAQDDTVAQRPAGSADRVFIGVGFDNQTAQGWIGGVEHVTLRSGERSPTWMSAEYLSWVKPDQFYVVEEVPG